MTVISKKTSPTWTPSGPAGGQGLSRARGLRGHDVQGQASPDDLSEIAGAHRFDACSWVVPRRDDEVLEAALPQPQAAPGMISDLRSYSRNSIATTGLMINTPVTLPQMRVPSSHIQLNTMPTASSLV